MPRLLSDDALLPLTRRHQTLLQTINEKAAPTIDSAWDALSAYNEGDIVDFARSIASMMDAVKRSSVNVTAGYLSSITGTQAAVNVDDVGADFDPRDPFLATWKALKDGYPFDEAVEMGRNQAHAMARDFNSSAARLTGGAFAKEAGLNVRGWSRVPDGGACAWCQQVAGQLYHSAESADFGHNRCGCTAIPVFADDDPAQVIADAVDDQTIDGVESILSDKQWSALNPKGGWDFNKQKRTVEALRQTPDGRMLLETMSRFQSGASRSIPLLRTNIEKHLAGETLEPGAKARVENILNALRTNPISPPERLWRGMRLDGSADDIVARYTGSDKLDLNLSSFSSDKKLATSFRDSGGAGQKGTRNKNTTGVLVELEGKGARTLPIEKISRSGLYADEKEWVSAGRYEVVSVTKQKDGNVLLKIRQIAALGD
jgi:hypothetical protein